MPHAHFQLHRRPTDFRFRQQHAQPHGLLQLFHRLQSARRFDFVHTMPKARPALTRYDTNHKSPPHSTRSVGWSSATITMLWGMSRRNTPRATPTRHGGFSGRAGKPLNRTRRAVSGYFPMMTRPGSSASQDQLGNLTQTFYDGQNHVVMTISPLDETNQFIYDGNNNLASGD